MLRVKPSVDRSGILIISRSIACNTVMNIRNGAFKRTGSLLDLNGVIFNVLLTSLFIWCSTSGGAVYVAPLSPWMRTTSSRMRLAGAYVLYRSYVLLSILFSGFISFSSWNSGNSEFWYMAAQQPKKIAHLVTEQYTFSFLFISLFGRDRNFCFPYVVNNLKW